MRMKNEDNFQQSEWPSLYRRSKNRKDPAKENNLPLFWKLPIPTLTGCYSLNMVRILYKGCLDDRGYNSKTFRSLI